MYGSFFCAFFGATKDKAGRYYCLGDIFNIRNNTDRVFFGIAQPRAREWAGHVSRRVVAMV